MPASPRRPLLLAVSLFLLLPTLQALAGGLAAPASEAEEAQEGASGHGDSPLFILDTRSGASGFGDSNVFVLDTREEEGADLWLIH